MSDRLPGERELERGALLALLTVGYAVLAIVSILLFQFDDGRAGIWLPNVFAVALMLRKRSLRPAPAVAAVFAGCLVAKLLLGAPGLPSLVYSLANAATVLVEAMLLKRLVGERGPIISGARDYAAMLAAGGIAGPALVAALYAPVAVAAQAFGRPLIETFLSWIIGDALGFAVLLPALLMADRPALAGLLGRTALVRLAATTGASILLAVAAASWAEIPFVLVIVPSMALAALAAPFELAVGSASVGAAVLGLGVAGALGPLDTPDGGLVHGFQLSVTVISALPFVVGLVFDRTRRDGRRLVESEERFRRAMHDSAIGVAVVGLDGRFIETNHAFAAMLGHTRQELEALTFFQITHPDDMSISLETWRRIQLGDAMSYKLEKRYLRKDGTPVWARLSGSVTRDAATGAPLYLVSQVEDIDARRRSEEALAAADTRWDFALACAGQGIWDLDRGKGRVTYSSTWKKMLGYEDDQLDGDPDRWLTLVHPDDRARVEEADRAHIAGESAMFEAEFRMRRKDGTWLWILDRGMVVERDRDGRMVRAVGTLTDITARREAEERIIFTAALLADEKERLRVTLDSIGDAVICTDAAMRVTFMNPVAERLTGIVESGALGRPLEEVYAPADEETGERITTATALAGMRQRVEHNSRAILSKKDGSRCCIREVVSPILNDRGDFCGSVIVFQDFTDARALQRRLVHAAAHDSLTGLANRASLLSTLSGILSAPRSGSAGDLFLFVDLDNFKVVNDTSGHAAGDLLLKRVADTIRAAMRPGDVAARLGGDEFAMILRDCEPAAGVAIAEGIIAAIKGLDLGLAAAACEVGASIGLTTVGRHEPDVDVIIARADFACYRAKANGRGCVVEAPASPRRQPVLARAS